MRVLGRAPVVLIAAGCLGLHLAACSQFSQFVERARGKETRYTRVEEKEVGSIVKRMRPALLSGQKHYLVGRHFQDRGRDREALKEFARSAAIDPSNVKARIGMGISLDRMGLYDRAQRAYRRALALDPESHEALNNLGYSLMLQGEHAAAAEVLEKAVSLEGSGKRQRNNLGRAYLEIGDFDGALACFRSAMEEGAANYLVGDRLYREGRYGEARELFAAALEINPAFGGAKRGLEASEGMLALESAPQDRDVAERPASETALATAVAPLQAAAAEEAEAFPPPTVVAEIEKSEGIGDAPAADASDGVKTAVVVKSAEAFPDRAAAEESVASSAPGRVPEAAAPETVRATAVAADVKVEPPEEAARLAAEGGGSVGVDTLPDVKAGVGEPVVDRVPVESDPGQAELPAGIPQVDLPESAEVVKAELEVDLPEADPFILARCHVKEKGEDLVTVLQFLSQEDYYSSLSIEIVDGSGVEGLAEKVGQCLTEKGYRRISFSDCETPPCEQTKILYCEDFLQPAFQVAKAVPGYQEMEKVASLPREDVKIRVFVGRDAARSVFQKG